MKLKEKRGKILSKIMLTIIASILYTNTCFATGIGTQEVQAATDNIKRVITSIAMPLRWCIDFRKYCYSCIKNDCKCKQSSKKS